METNPIDQTYKVSENLIDLNVPFVSIIMPLYNAEKYVAEAIESVLAQTYTHWELIIVNDGSTDSSVAETNKVLENLIGFEREKIRVYSQENKGASAARNYGFSLSKGEYIKFFDSDDILSANMLALQVAALEEKNQSIAISSWGRFYQDDINTFRLVNHDFDQVMTPVDWIQKSWRNAQPMTQPGMFLIHRKTIEEAGLWNEKLSLIDDFEFFTRIILVSKQVKLSTEAILYYRSGLPNALSGQKSRKAVESAYLSLDLGTSYLLQAQNNTLTRLCCANMWQGFVYEFYYQQPDLSQKAEAKIKELGGSDIPFPCGGWTKVLVMVLGWKDVMKMKSLFKK